MDSALIGYIWYEAPEEEQETFLLFGNSSMPVKREKKMKNLRMRLMNCFEELEADNPEHFAVRQYRKKYKLAAEKQRSRSLFPAAPDLLLLISRNFGRSCLMMKWSWI